jgi:hypothetical protein
LILLRPTLAETPSPLADRPTVATFALLADPRNESPVALGEDKNKAVEMAPGVELRFERVDLSGIAVSGKSTDRLYVAGWAGD